MKKKVLFVFGTRPEAIKMAPLINIFKENNNKFITLVAVTAQHREMLDQVLNIFNIIPDYDLDLMSSDQTLESLTGKVLNGISNLLIDEKPELIFVQGDTTTTYASALAAFYKKIPVAHIEAGLRTNDKYSPFPEEINRRMTSEISTYHFPPTETAMKNLLNEGIDKERIKVTGNTVIDSLLSVSRQIDKGNFDYEKKFTESCNIDFNNKKTILITGHRRESFGKGFENICHAIKSLANDNDIQFIYPVHLNPNVQEPVNRILGNLPNIFLIEPQDYIPFIFLMKKAYIILTDSGGVQEEAPSLGVPVLVMRNTTERIEGVNVGTANLVGTDKDKIQSSIELLLNNKAVYDKMAKAINPYGNGQASLKIYNYILSNIFN